MNLLLEYLLLKNKSDMKNKKGVGKIKVEILMVLKEDPNPEKISDGEMVQMACGMALNSQ